MFELSHASRNALPPRRVRRFELTGSAPASVVRPILSHRLPALPAGAIVVWSWGSA